MQIELTKEQIKTLLKIVEEAGPYRFATESLKDREPELAQITKALENAEPTVEDFIREDLEER